MSSSSPHQKNSLVKAPVGQTQRIQRITDLSMAKRLFAMGLLPGSDITLVRQGFAKGTCYVKSGMITLALRQEEAAAILVE